MELQGDSLLFRMGSSPELRGPMRHWNLDTYQITLGDERTPPILAQFVLDPEGKVGEMRIPEFDGAVFRRAP